VLARAEYPCVDFVARDRRFARPMAGRPLAACPRRTASSVDKAGKSRAHLPTRQLASHSNKPDLLASARRMHPPYSARRLRSDRHLTRALRLCRCGLPPDPRTGCRQDRRTAPHTASAGAQATSKSRAHSHHLPFAGPVGSRNGPRSAAAAIRRPPRVVVAELPAAPLWDRHRIVGCAPLPEEPRENFLCFRA
jgi:hypothetical protein